MAYASPTMQGRFTSTGRAQQISIPSSFDWIWVYNETNLYAAGGANSGAQFYFQRGMTNGRGVIYVKEATIGALAPDQIAAGSGFTLLDTSDMTLQLSAAVAITNTTNATNPVISTANTAGLAAGSIVRLYNMSSGHSVDGMDFVVDTVTANTSFRLGGVFQTAPFANGAATGSYRIVNYNSGPWSPWYPPYRTIINITRANPMVVTLSVPSNYQVGQEVVFNIPSGYGMTELDGVTGTITAVSNANASPSITLNIDSSGFSAFTFINTVSIKNRAIVAPVGANTAYILGVNGNILNDATYNTELVGVLLGADATNPARSVCGENGDVIYWIAGSSANVNNL
jgi:hypothetical protein